MIFNSLLWCPHFFFFLPELEVGVCLAVNYTAANSWSISTFSKLLSLFSEELEHSYKISLKAIAQCHCFGLCF